MQRKSGQNLKIRTMIRKKTDPERKTGKSQRNGDLSATWNSAFYQWGKSFLARKQQQVISVRTLSWQLDRRNLSTFPLASFAQFDISFSATSFRISIGCIQLKLIKMSHKLRQVHKKVCKDSKEWKARKSDRFIQIFFGTMD